MRILERGGEFSVELVTSETGKRSGAPVPIPAFNVAAEPLRYLDYILEEVQSAVVPFDIGILVRRKYSREPQSKVTAALSSPLINPSVSSCPEPV